MGESIVFAMEYVEGYDLAQLVKARGRCRCTACNFVYQAALGLQHAHEEGLVHRDIKPGNLMLYRKRTGDGEGARLRPGQGDPREKVDDNFTSRRPSSARPTTSHRSRSSTPRRADIRADIYSLGGTFYYLLTGGPPSGEFALRHSTRPLFPGTPILLNLIRPEVQAELAALVAKMMAKDPATGGSRRPGKWHRL